MRGLLLFLALFALVAMAHPSVHRRHHGKLAGVVSKRAVRRCQPKAKLVAAPSSHHSPSNPDPTPPASQDEPDPKPTPKSSNNDDEPDPKPDPTPDPAPDPPPHHDDPKPTSEPAPTSGSSTPASDIGAYLSGHNSLRAKHGADALTWSDDLASAAAKWASKCVFQHSGGALGAFGENLAAGTGSAYGISQGLNSWATEPYKDGVPSHFTQMVWKNSKQVGCAQHSCDGIFDASFGKAKYIVCEYSPQGNVIGQFDSNVQA